MINGTAHIANAGGTAAAVLCAAPLIFTTAIADRRRRSCGLRRRRA
ncbi:hypothetical protein [Adlercreutzia caecimuris]|nr:hypothetical protein [Adlercreutzia caecimuris]